MPRPPVIAAVAILGVIALAGCGSPPSYTLEKTRACLEDAGARIAKPQNDFVAETATAGTFRAILPGNAVTISFGDTEDEAKQTADGYFRFHAKNVGVADILRQERNAVMLWKQHPTDAELAEVTDCLK